MKYGFIYMWISNTSNKKYIGSHYGTTDDGYISSSNYFNEIYEKNTTDFTRTILATGLTRECALTQEQEMLCNRGAATSPDYYNLHNFSGKGWSHHDHPALAQVYYNRISAAKKGQPSPHKGKQLWGDHNRHKLKIDKWLIIDPHGNEFEIENMLEFCKKHNLNPSTMSAVARGKRRHYKGYWCKKLTNTRNVDYEYKNWTSKGKPGKAMFGSENSFAKPIEVNGIVYGSMTEAVSDTGLSMYKLRKLRNENGK
jgi:hypothetical protein